MIRARAEPTDTAVCTDFDGTLAEIVLDPSAAVALPGVADLLETLTATYATVAVVSGRPIAFLRHAVGGSARLSGLYGLEELRDGELVEHPEGERWRSVVADVVGRAAEALPGDVDVEPKGLSVTAHYRRAPQHEAAVVRWAAAEAARTGLLARPAKRSIELHPPIRADKGTALRSLAGQATHVCFVGDDLGDLPAFDAVADLRRDGIDGLCVAVRSAELAPELAAVADLVVDHPAGARDFLAALVP